MLPAIFTVSPGRQVFGTVTQQTSALPLHRIHIQNAALIVDGDRIYGFIGVIDRQVADGGVFFPQAARNSGKASKSL
ncbi:hypothetical protein BI343_15620 [Chromobacterium amazonense]|nr:hypothetical protein BI343_15620 [Chromobacterium amazonense]